MGFCLWHELRIEIECDTKKYATELLDIFGDADYISDDNRWIKLKSLRHFSHKMTYNSVKQVIEELFEKIPEIESII